jgi:hypothetical protein
MGPHRCEGLTIPCDYIYYQSLSAIFSFSEIKRLIINYFPRNHGDLKGYLLLINMPFFLTFRAATYVGTYYLFHAQRNRVGDKDDVGKVI